MIENWLIVSLNFLVRHRVFNGVFNGVRCCSMRELTVEVPMVNGRLQADMATMLEGLQEQLHGIAELQRQRSLLTATVVVCDKRIQVTVNADGLLVDTLFAEDIGDLSYEEIATAITAAVQAATAEVMRRSSELMQPLPGVGGGMPMGAPGAAGGTAQSGKEHKHAKFLDSRVHLDDALGDMPRKVKPVIEP
jgi:DNA-binding protein YbaB